MEKIDFTSDDPLDQRGIMTNFEEQMEGNGRGQKRRLEEVIADQKSEENG